MKRTPSSKSRQVDFLKPVIPELIEDTTECFGKEWEPSDSLCAICSDMEICGIAFNELVVKKKKSEFEARNVPLDLNRFKEVKWDKLIKVVQDYEAKKEPMTWEEMLDYIRDISNVHEMSILEAYAKTHMIEYKLINKDNLIYYAG